MSDIQNVLKLSGSLTNNHYLCTTMRKIICLIAFYLSLHTTAQGQGVWTWLGGDTFQPSHMNNFNRGTKGVASSSNRPPRYIVNGYNWKDAQDKFWVFGSFDQFNNGLKDTSEVWSYDWKANQWTWEAGFDTMYIDGFIPDSFMQKLRLTVSYAFEQPHWTDSIGNFWYLLYGLSNGINSTCDVILKFNVQSKRLVIVDYRIDYSNYGTKGVTSPANWPNFSVSSATWCIGQRVFVFGGYTKNGTSNELWEYNMATGYWTWHGGASPPSGVNYGTKGVAASSNWPNGFASSTSKWTKGNKCYLFGGYINNDNKNASNELWEYDISTGHWTWLSGEKITVNDNHLGIYSSKTCMDTPGIFPSARSIGSSLNTNVCNNSFWLFSGSRFKGNGYVFYADLWLYKPNVNRWVWVYGNVHDSTYSYGQKGVSSITNKPPPRTSGMMWTDNQDRLYLFGGFEYNKVEIPSGPYNYYYGNDLWRYDPDYSCINYNLSEKFIDRNIKYKICQGDSTVVKVLAGYDSLRVIPVGSDVSIRTVAGDAEIWLKPSATKSYKIIAYGYRCESLLDSLTVPLVVSPPRTSSETKTICYGASYMGKNTSGTYSFNYPDPLKCDSVHTLTLTVRPQNIKMIDSTVCEGVSVYGRSVSGSFRDTFTGSNSCDSIRQLNLTVIPKNQLIDTAICRGQSLAGYTAAGTYYDTLTSTQGCVTYRVIKLTIKEPSSSSYNQSICEGQTYWGHSTEGTHIDILPAANGCDSTRTLNLTVNKKSYFTLNQEICRGESFEGKSAAGTYLDTFLNAKGCDSIRTLVLTLRNPRIIKKLKDTAICRGSEATLDAGLGHKDYLWSTGELSPSILVKNEGEYKLIFTDTANCIGRDSAKVKYHNDTEIILQDEISNYKGELLFLNPQIKPSDVGGKYRWSPSHIFQCDSCRSARFKLDNSAVVRLEFTDAQGCKAYKDVVVNIYDSWAVGFPTAFSPNGDSLNDEYFPNVANILSYTYAVYNRWGEKVHQATNIQPAWNGTFRGQPAPMGMYSYYAEVVLLNGVRQTYSGSFQIMR